MARKAKTFTTLEIDSKIKKGEPGSFAVGGTEGLCIRIRKLAGGVSAAWYLRKQGEGQRFNKKIGDYPKITLKRARDIASKMLLESAQGINPVTKAREEREAAKARKKAEQEQAKKTASFASVALRALESPMFSGVKYLSREKGRLQKHVLNVIGDIPIIDCTPDEVIKVYKTAYENGIQQPTIEKLTPLLNKVFKYAVLENIIENNPLKSTRFEILWGSLEKPSRQTLHQGALLPEEIPAFFAYVVETIIASDEKNTGSLGARCFLFSILTCLRSANARGAKWADIAPDFSSMTIAAHEMKESKNGNHTVFFAPEVRDLVRSMPQLEESPYVFDHAGKMLSDMAFSSVINRVNRTREKNGLAPFIDTEQTKQTGRTIALTQHGLARATFRTWCQNTNNETQLPNVAEDVCELMLHHAFRGSGGLGRAYQRYDYVKERRAAFEAWAKFCLSKTPLERWELVVNRAKYVKEQ